MFYTGGWKPGDDIVNQLRACFIGRQAAFFRSSGLLGPFEGQAALVLRSSHEATKERRDQLIQFESHLNPSKRGD